MTPLVIFIVLPFVLSLLCTFIVIWAAQRYGWLTAPGIRCVHKNPTPRLGGIAIFLACFGSWMLVLSIQGWDMLTSLQRVILLGAPMAFFIGLRDDVRPLGSKAKLALQLLLGFFVFQMGLRINVVSWGPDVSWSLGFMALPVTLLWIAGVMNAVNLIDGIDGLAGGISSIALGAIAIITFIFGDGACTFGTMVPIAALLGFLVFNFSPARIFMGDSGSMFIGFLLATLTISMLGERGHSFPIYIPLLVLGYPLVDMLVSILRRTIHTMDEQAVQNSPYSMRKILRRILLADGDHIHHRLLSWNCSHRRVMFSLCLVSMGTSLIAIAMLIVPAQIGGILLAGAAILAFHLIQGLGYSEFVSSKVRRRRLEKQYDAPIGSSTREKLSRRAV